MIADNGFVCLWRNMLYDPVWYNSTPEQKVLLITLLLMVCWKEQEYDVYGEKLTLKPGQIVTSVAEIKKLTGKHVSTKNIRTGIDRFKKMNFLAKETTKRGTLITIVNWRKYQDGNFESGKESGNELAKDWQATGKGLAMNWQRGGKPIKEQRQQREQSNKVTKEQYINTYGTSKFKKPTLDEVKEYCHEKGYTFSPNAFIDYYESNGWRVGKNPMKNWKAACSTWQRNNRGVPVQKEEFDLPDYFDIHGERNERAKQG